MVVRCEKFFTSLAAFEQTAAKTAMPVEHRTALPSDLQTIYRFLYMIV